MDIFGAGGAILRNLAIPKRDIMNDPVVRLSGGVTWSVRDFNDRHVNGPLVAETVEASHFSTEKARKYGL